MEMTHCFREIHFKTMQLLFLTPCGSERECARMTFGTMRARYSNVLNWTYFYFLVAIVQNCLKYLYFSEESQLYFDT